MSTNTFATANAIFKKSYAKLPSDLTPEFVYFSSQAPEAPASEKTGGNFTQPVILSSESGYTLAAANSDAFELRSPEALATGSASLGGSQLVLRSAMSYEALKRSETDKNAYMNLTRLIVKNMLKTSYNIKEALIMWGQSNVGVVSAVATTTATLTTASWAPGLWWGSENRTISFYSSGGVRRGTAKVSTYSMSGRTVTFDIDLTTIGVLATDVMYLSTGGSAVEMQGLYNAFTTTAGSVWGLDNTNYNLWQPGAAYSAGSAALTFNKIIAAVTEGSERGLGLDIKETDTIVNPRGWNNLNQDVAAFRRTDSSYKASKFEEGHEVIEFFSNTGVIRILSHQMMKEGFAFILPRCSKSLKQIGAQVTPTFALPGMTKDGMDYIRPMENNAGAEIRLYWNSAIFSEYVSQFKLINGIVNA